MQRKVRPGGKHQALVDLGSLESETVREGTLTMRRLQYRTLIRTSMGALQMDKRFLTRNSRGDRVWSASKATAKVIVDIERPMTVKYWKCQPYDSFLQP